MDSNQPQLEDRPATTEAKTTVPPHATPAGGIEFVKAVLLGVVAATFMSLVYSVVDIVSGTVLAMREHKSYLPAVLGLFVIKLVGPAAALVIGKAMMFGSGGRTGPPYRIAAVLLTYFAITMAEVPVLFWQFHLQGQDVTHVSFGLMTAMAQYGLTSPLIGMQDVTSGTVGVLFLIGSMVLAWWAAAPLKPKIPLPTRTAKA